MESSKKPRFSVVIPAYNEATFIADTLDSLFNQVFDGEVEIIVVDNNSSDQTAAVARGLGAKVVKEKNPGVCWARQKGTEAANGEIIVGTDADTYFDPHWLARIDRQFKKNPKVIAVAGPCRYVNGPLWATIYPHLLFVPFSIIYKLTGRTLYASATNIAFYKNNWHGYDTALTQGGDELDLLRRLRKEGRVAFDNNNPTYTSARRQVRGFLYNFFITFWIYYILEYNLARIFKRPVLGSAPHFRNELSPKVLNFMNFFIYGGITVGFLLYTSVGHQIIHRTDIAIRQTDHAIKNKIDEKGL